ncbi:MAG: hypothetical protein ACR2IN_01365 [Thermoleophilaceae bacterium]
MPLFPDPQGEAAKELSRLEAAILEATAKRNAEANDQRRREAEANRIHRELVEAVAAGKETGELEQQLAEAKAAADERWRLVGLERAEQRAKEARDAHIEDHFEELFAELVPDAQAARERVLAALAEAREAVNAWQGEAARMGELMRRRPDVDGFISGTAEVERLGRSLRSPGDIPAPVPRSMLIREREEVTA